MPVEKDEFRVNLPVWARKQDLHMSYEPGISMSSDAFCKYAFSVSEIASSLPMLE